MVPGLGILLKKEPDESGDNFFTVLTELNLAKKLLDVGVPNLKYENERKVDFTLDGMAISMKSLNVKEYERKIQEISNRLREQGGGRDSFSYKGGSTITITVAPTTFGTFSEEIVETGSVHYLDTDYAHLQALLGNLAEFESVPSQEGRKKVLVVVNYSESFAEYYAKDLADWYFDIPQAHPIFPDPATYFKYFGSEIKNGSIDGIVFIMYPLVPFLVWPDGHLQKTGGSQTMTLIFSRDEGLVAELKRILFSNTRAST